MRIPSIFAMITALFAGNFDPAKAPTYDTIYPFSMADIDGHKVDFAKYKGKVLLIVNVASKCGLTPQYTQLEQVYEAHKADGLLVLGFPANNFMGQEPGTNAEIKAFCKTKYSVSFPMFSKISVKGDDMHPLYQWLIAKSDNHDPIDWNFAKFVVGRDGKVKARFSARTKPDSPEVTEALKKALAEKS